MTKNSKIPNQAFIFAAGRGQRMRPLTDSIPKPLVKINDKSIIDYAIDKLYEISDIKTIIINGFYLANQIEDHIKNLEQKNANFSRETSKKIIFSRETSKLETGGGLIFAQNKIDFNQPLLTINGDILWQETNDTSDIKKLARGFENQDCDILLGLTKTTDYFGYEGNGDFNIDTAGNLKKDAKNKMSYAYTGLQIINPKILKLARETCFSMSYFFNLALKNGDSFPKIKGIELDAKYFHIGTVETLKEAQKLLNISKK